jgi:uncharacterized protein (DUF302 family)
MTTTNIAGLHTVRSTLEPKETMDRLEQTVRDKGMTIFARIDHAAGARDAGLPLCPTELLIFGDARVGTRLMQLTQTLGIDLPLKALVWQDEAGQTWVAYDEPRFYTERHGVADASEPVTTKMAAALAAVVQAAIERH